MALFNPDNFLSRAPCYWRLSNDGALFRCSDCQQLKVYSEMYYILTPNGNKRVLCEACIDEDWLRNATPMPERI